MAGDDSLFWKRGSALAREVRAAWYAYLDDTDEDGYLDFDEWLACCFECLERRASRFRQGCL